VPPRKLRLVGVGQTLGDDALEISVTHGAQRIDGRSKEGSDYPLPQERPATAPSISPLSHNQGTWIPLDQRTICTNRTSP
jgi:hypothetical protein